MYYADLVNNNHKELKYYIVWDKVLTSGFLNAKRMPLRQHKQVAVFYRKLPVYNPQFTEDKPLHGKGTSYLNRESINNNYDDFAVIKDERKGSTQKYPTSMLTFQKPHYLIKTYSNESDVVLDFTIGSGTTEIACMNTNRKFIGMKIDNNYFNVALVRIEEARKLYLTQLLDSCYCELK